MHAVRISPDVISVRTAAVFVMGFFVLLYIRQETEDHGITILRRKNIWHTRQFMDTKVSMPT